jgi:hypothetical protein
LLVEGAPAIYALFRLRALLVRHMPLFFLFFVSVFLFSHRCSHTYQGLRGLPGMLGLRVLLLASVLLLAAADETYHRVRTVSLAQPGLEFAAICFGTDPCFLVSMPKTRKLSSG